MRAPLTAAFVESAPAAVATQELEATLRGMFDSAKSRWDRLDVAADVFVRYVATRVRDEADPIAAAVGLDTDDLFLACACTSGDARAIEAFESTYGALVGAVVRRLGGTGPTELELREHLRRHLFVPREAAPPAISQYSGRGPLGAWLRVTATRAAIGLKRQASRSDRGKQAERALGEALLQGTAVASDPELRLLLERCQDALRDAVHRAAAELSPRQRSLLRLSLSERYSVRQLGKMYGVHHATAARWLREAYADLTARIRTHLGDGLGVESVELQSVVRAVRSHLDLTLSRALPQDAQGDG